MARLQSSFNDYLVWGGFPELILYESEDGKIIKEVNREIEKLLIRLICNFLQEVT